MGKNNAKIVPYDLFAQVGISPTGLPLKLGTGMRCNTKDDLIRKLRNQDKDLNVNMFDWSNTQLDLTSQDINRLLYYRGQLAFAYLEELDQFVLLPFAIDGNLDMYGRARYIRLLPFTSSAEDKRAKTVEDYLANKRFKVVNTVKNIMDLKPEDLTQSAVILYDYTPTLSYNVIPMNVMNQVLIDLEAEIYAFMRTNLINASGVTGIRVQDENSADEVGDANKALLTAALTAQKYVPIIANVDFQELTVANGNTQEFLQAAQAVRNLRLALNGIPTSGVYNKSQYVSTGEADLNAEGETDAALTFQDRYTRRDEFCNIVNSIWYIGIDVLPSENVVHADLDANGAVFDDQTDNHDAEQGGQENE